MDNKEKIEVGSTDIDVVHHEKMINISREEYDFLLMWFGRDVSVKGFRKNRVNPSILHNLIGKRVCDFITQGKVQELLSGYSKVSNVKTKAQFINNVLCIHVRFDGIENPKKKEDNISDSHICNEDCAHPVENVDNNNV